MRGSLTRVVGALFAAAITTSCSLIVDTSGLARGGTATDASTADSSAEGAPPPGSDARAAEEAGRSVVPDGGCGVLQAACSGSAPCCAGLQCGDDRRCLTCLPVFDDCTSNEQCCSKNCNPVTTICE